MTKIDIKGDIINSGDAWVYEWLEIEHTSANSVNRILKDATGDIEVVINSGGGDVHAGSEIYTALKSYEGNVNVKIVGVCASAASVIAMSGDKVLMSPTSQIMIHNASMVWGGDNVEFQTKAEVLKTHDKGLANAYVLKTGLTLEEILNMMEQETWFDAQSAIDKGFADEMLFQNDGPVKLVAGFGTSMINQNVIDKIRSIKEQEKPNMSVGTDIILSENDIENIANKLIELRGKDNVDDTGENVYNEVVDKDVDESDTKKINRLLY